MNNITRRIIANLVLFVCFILFLIVYASFNENIDQQTNESQNVQATQLK